ncbi:MAG: response regulator [Thiomargarita sp.]|nr:response regulator [Thiomargarita sp.]
MNYQSTILIVDDEQIHRDTLEILLSNQGYKFVFAKNGQDALSLASKHTPDIILLDVMMPDIDGFEVCLTLRADPLLAEIPIIMLTSLDSMTLRQKGLEVGADEFLLKPFDHAELRARVHTITKLNRYRRLTSEKNKFEHVVEHASDGYLTLDQKGDILYANPRARLYLDLPRDPDEPILETFVVHTAKCYRCEPKEIWNTWLEKQDTPQYLVVRPETSTSKAFWLQISVTKISSGKEENLICLTDVTENIISERLKWTLNSQISHKFRTPFLPLVYWLKVLTAKHKEISELERDEHIQNAYKSAVHLQNEIEEIIQYMNIHTKAKTTDILCSISDILSIINTLDLEEKKIDVQVCHENYTQPEKCYVTLTYQAIELILRELFDNAKKFHPNGNPKLKIEMTLNDGLIHLKITDDGLHLSPKQLSKIWTSYYQGEKCFTGEVIGMGLGLSMIASLIWEVSGTCRAYNRTDTQGLVIELIFPLSA